MQDPDKDKQNMLNNIDRTEDKISLEKQVLKIINDKKIKPRPKWHFILNELFFWAICILLVVMASLVVSIFIYTLIDSDNGVINNTGLVFGYLEYFLALFFWISIFLVIAALAYFDFIKTKYGYRRFFKATYIVIGIYLSLGTIFYLTNSFEFIERFFINKVPYYHIVSKTKMSIWSRPEEGFLGGDVREIYGEKSCANSTSSNAISKIILKDFHGEVWDIKYNQTKWNIIDCLSKYDRIRILGKNSSNDKLFEAKEILDW